MDMMVFGRCLGPFFEGVGGSKRLKWVLLVIPLNWQKGHRGMQGRETVGEVGSVRKTKRAHTHTGSIIIPLEIRSLGWGNSV